MNSLGPIQDQTDEEEASCLTVSASNPTVALLISTTKNINGCEPPLSDSYMLLREYSG